MHPPDLVIIIVIALIVFGPKRPPQLWREIGEAIAEFHHRKNGGPGGPGGPAAA